MKCLSIQQPWACAIVNGYKTIENRTWRYPPVYRGPVLIHAGKTEDEQGWLDIMMIDFAVHTLIAEKSDLDVSRARGAIIGAAILTDVVTSPCHCNSKWYFGDFGFVFEMPVVFSMAAKCPGELGLFDIRDSLLTDEEKNWYTPALFSQARAKTAQRYRDPRGWDAA